MKYFLFFLFLAGWHYSSFCQDDSSRIAVPDTMAVKPMLAKKKAKPVDPRNFHRNNRVKINLYSLLLNNYSFSYERMLTHRLSVQAGFRYQPYGYLLDNVIGRIIAKKETIDFKFYNFQTANSAVTVDFRFYMSKRKPGQGMYVGVYGRYAHFDVDNMEYKYISTNKTVYDVPLVGNLTGYGGGLAIGFQWLIKKRITIDYCVFGGHYGKLNGTVISNKDLSGLSDAEKTELQGDLVDMFTVGSRNYLSPAVSNKGVNGKIDGPLYGLRTGISIGLAF